MSGLQFARTRLQQNVDRSFRLVNPRPKPLNIEGPSISPLSVLRVLWKRRWIILSLSVICFAASAFLVMRLPAVYKSETLVLIDSQKIPEKFVSSTVSTDVTDRLAAISQEILSSTRLLKIIHDLDLYKEERKRKTQEEIVEQMRRDITVNVQKDNWATGKPVAFKVGYQGKNPALVAEVANQLANLYIEENLQTREVEASGTSDFIDNQLNEAKHQLDQQEARVAHFKEQHNGYLPEQESSLLSMAESLRVQLQGIQDSIDRAQQNKLMVETTLSTGQVSEANLERNQQARRFAAAVSSPGEVSLGPEDKSLVELRQKLEELKSRYTPNHPDIIQLKTQIAQMEKQQAALYGASSANKSPKTAVGVNQGKLAVPAPVSEEILQQRSKIALLQAQLVSVKHEIELHEAERQSVLQQIRDTQAKVGQLPIVEQQMAALTRDYDTSKANYKSLLDKQIAAQMSTDMERRQKSERFEVIDPARVPEKPFKPNRKLLLVAALAGSIVLALLVGVGLELRNPVLLGEWELPKDVPILGRVPVINLGAAQRPESRKLALAMKTGSVTVALIAAACVYYFLKVRA